MNGLAATARISRADLADLIDAGATVFLEQGTCEPLELKAALIEHLDKEIRLIAAPVNGLNDCEFGLRNSARLNPTVFVSTPQLAEPLLLGAVSYVPLHWSEVMRSIRERFVPDVALLQVSPPDADGYCNLGANAAFELELAHLAKRVVAEVNANVPTVTGDTRLHVSRINHWIEGTQPLRAMPGGTWGAIEEQIAGFVEPLVPAGCTLQIGPGRVPDAVLDRLHRMGRRVRFHSGILTDAMLRLARTQRGRGRDGSDARVVAGMLLGSEALYQAVDRDPDVELRCTAHTHSLAVMAAIESFVSVNSAVEVDLLGQVNAENADGRQISGVGGQVDFFRGARASPGGRSIIALPSATRTRSRIVPFLAAGTPVSTSRVDVDCVVTEYGCAELRNRTEGERAEALIRIAHPSHREALARSLTQRATCQVEESEEARDKPCSRSTT